MCYVEWNDNCYIKWDEKKINFYIDPMHKSIVIEVVPLALRSCVNPKFLPLKI